MMKNLCFACLALISCTAGSKVNSSTQKDPTGTATAKSTYYPYPSIYKNVGTVTPDTTTKNPK